MSPLRAETERAFSKPLEGKSVLSQVDPRGISPPSPLSHVPDPLGSTFQPTPREEGHVSSTQSRSPLRVAVKPALEKNNEQKAAELPPVVQPQTPDDRVENVIHYLRLISVGKAEAGRKDLKSFTALLLKDGRVFENEERAPDVFDPAQRPSGSAGTGQWQKDGEAYALTFTDGTAGTAVSSAALTSPAPPKMVLSGVFEDISEEKTFAPRLTFFKDGSLLLQKENKTSESGRYSIHRRSIEIDDGQGTRTAFLFGVQEPFDNPRLLIIGNKLYQKKEDN